MRGGLRRWKRGSASRGVRNALGYALEGTCDSHLRSSSGQDALLRYSQTGGATVTRLTVESGAITTDDLGVDALRRWINGDDLTTGEPRGRDLRSENADLLLDGTINFAKSCSLAALIDPDLAVEFDALQDRLRDRIIRTWQQELNARRGAGGCHREPIRRIEVVELQHSRSRALDPHAHRHLWLSMKVLGEDGLWSNLDSRVAMKLHTVINAEGELAARTDPRWIAALNARGLTLDSEGEINELRPAVRPFSRRANQIEANRVALIAEWESAHPGCEPGPDDLRHIDDLAWAKGRPNKPSGIDENEWERKIFDELVRIDPCLLQGREPIAPSPIPIADLDRNLLAATAIVDADQRSVSSSGRFSAWDVRAGAMRAVSRSRVVCDRSTLDELIEDVTQRALERTVDLLDDDPDKPPHIKALMAMATAALKSDLDDSFAALAEPGRTARPSMMRKVAETALGIGHELDPGQIDAAVAVSGTARLVSVIGPAGAGKTTILRVAEWALRAQRRRLIVVAPTKKAALVAERELGATASSLHGLLADHGWRWGTDAAGAQVWTQLKCGEQHGGVGAPFDGPHRYPISPGDRIVVDEAGMVDLHAASALATLAAQTGAGIVMMGDPHQAAPVGHAGAMATMTAHADAVELTDLHRFDDPAYGELTLRLRDPRTAEDAIAVATDLDVGGHILRVDSADHAREAMVSAYFEWTMKDKLVALVTATNDEARDINEAIQERRIARGELSQKRVALGRDRQRILEGDVVQTRKNDSETGVQNRANWRVQRIRGDRLDLVAVSDTTIVRRVTLDYAADHVHLAYASTVHGIQGETTDASIVGPGVDAAGLYVGLTRGRISNHAIAVSRSAEEARSMIAGNMTHGQIEASIEESRRVAESDLRRAARPPETSDPWARVDSPIAAPVHGGIGIR
jgi:exodeoxyribonuclease V alpha subunit